MTILPTVINIIFHITYIIDIIYIIILKKIFCDNRFLSQLLVYQGKRLSNFIGTKLLWQRNNDKKKGTHLDNIYKEVIKASDFVSVQIQYLSSRLLTLIQERKNDSKLYRSTVTYIVNPEVLRATKKSLTTRLKH